MNDVGHSRTRAIHSTSVQHQRNAGKRLTYDIRADDHGNFEILLNGKVLKRGTDPLVLCGLRAPGPAVMASAIRYAKAGILYLHLMREE